MSLSSSTNKPKGLIFKTVPLWVWPIWYLVATSFQGSSLSFLAERNIFEPSILIISASIISPTLYKSAGSSIRCQASSLIWIKPSRFSPKLMKTPKLVMAVIVPLTKVPTVYLAITSLCFSCQASFSLTTNFSSSFSKVIILTSNSVPIIDFSFSRILFLSPPLTRG